MAKGAYVLADAPDGKPEVILIGTGSEVSLCVEAYEQLTAEGVKARVVSMPSWELFEHQPEEYPRQRAAAAASRRASRWSRRPRSAGIVMSRSASIGMHTFGASAPLKELAEEIRLHARRRGGGSQRGDRHQRKQGDAIVGIMRHADRQPPRALNSCEAHKNRPVTGQ